MSGPPGPPQFCPYCGRKNDPPLPHCWKCGAELGAARFGSDLWTPGGPPGPPPPLASADTTFQPPGFARPVVSPGFQPPPPRPPRKDLSTGAIVVIIVVIVLAATAVPAAVFFVLVSPLGINEASPPYELGMTLVRATNSSGPPPSFYVNLSLAPTLGLAIDMFGLEVANVSTSLAAPLDDPSSGCVYHGGPVNSVCPSNGTGWYAVLEGPTGSILATYGGSGVSGAWANFGSSGPGVPVFGSDSLILISGSDHAFPSFGIYAFGTGTAAVSGYSEL